MELEDDTSESDLRSFLAALQEFARENEINTFSIKTHQAKSSNTNRLPYQLRSGVTILTPRKNPNTHPSKCIQPNQTINHLR